MSHDPPAAGEPLRPDAPIREARLRAWGVADADLPAMLAYCDTPYAAPPGRLPLADELHVEAWTDYERRARREGAVATLRDVFVQLRFPIRAGMSREEAYRRATLRGEFARAAPFSPGIVFERPEAITLEVVESVGGRVPVIVAGARADFEALVRAFTERNEPAEVPPSMGACLVSGLVNWDRVRRHREAWGASVADGSDEAWAIEFRALAADKARYLDRLILLSSGPYSAVPAEESRGAPEAWPGRSLAIRREHELFHYFTYRCYGRIRTHVLDELLADFAGLVGADGRYDHELARRCLGLDAGPDWRPDARLLNYLRGALPESAWPAVRRLALGATRTLAAIASAHQGPLRTPAGRAVVLSALCTLSLDDLADEAGPRLFDVALQTRLQE